MLKENSGYYDISNYRNSKYFINTVDRIRKWKNSREVVVFAGACQSYYEALIMAGANFASSPARILIDILVVHFKIESIAPLVKTIFLPL